jgi:hypothetical protein
MNRQTAHDISSWLGWLMLGGVITLIPLIYVDVLLLQIHATGQAWLLLARILFAFFLVTSGAIGLLRHSLAGYPLIYFATAVSFWAWLVPYVPVPQSWLPFAEKNCLVAPVLDFLVLIALGFAHISLVTESVLNTPGRRAAARAAVILFSTVFLLAWTGQYKFLEGRVEDLSKLPLIGHNLEPLSGQGSIQFRGVHLISENGFMIVFTGKAAPEDFLATMDRMQMTAVPADMSGKLLKLAHQWRLDRAGWPLMFAADDLRFTGRIAGSKSNLQICLNKTTGEFTGQIIAARLPY